MLHLTCSHNFPVSIAFWLPLSRIMAAYAWLQVSSFHLADNTSLPAAPEKKFSPVAVLESPRGDQKVPIGQAAKRATCGWAVLGCMMVGPTQPK